MTAFIEIVEDKVGERALQMIAQVVIGWEQQNPVYRYASYRFTSQDINRIVSLAKALNNS